MAECGNEESQENRTLISLETPLVEAAQMNHTDIVEVLLERRADMKAQDVMGLTALDSTQ
ncbi:MAG TPA: ankyrin repeat domain-containing protein [Steroidobacteraceae bacterium]|nr:ankyrin repeat domain-containing protein [Steroidobacteraceae bacterium]